MLKNLSVSAVLLASSVAMAAPPSLELVAPDNTVIAIGVKNFKDARARGKDHPLLALWSGNERAGGLNPMVELLPDSMRDLVEEAAHGAERLPAPDGAVGIAVFTASKEDVLMPIPAVMMMADYGAQAEAVEARLAEVIARGEASGAFTVGTHVFRGATVHSLTMPETPAGEEPNDFDDLDLDGMDGGGLGMFMPDPAAFIGEIDTVHIVRHGSVLLAGTDQRSIEQGLTALAGGEASVLIGSRAFRGVKKQLGEHDAYTVVMTGNVMPLVSVADPMGMSMMFAPMLRSAFGDIQGFGYGVDLGGETAPGHQQMAIYMPNGKQGLPALMDTAGARGAVPPFVGAGALSYATMNFEFDGVIPFIDRFVQANPMVMMQVGQQWQQTRRELEPICSHLGTRMHMVGGGNGAGVANRQGLIAVEYGNADAFKSAIATMAAGRGLQPEQVNGHTIYSAPADKVVPPMGFGPDLAGTTGSIGLGASHVFMGTDDAVRAALRGEVVAGRGNNLLLERVLEVLPKDGLVGWGFADLNAAMGAFAAMPGLDDAAKSAGPAVWTLRSTDDGFVCRMMQLAPVLSVQVE